MKTSHLLLICSTMVFINVTFFYMLRPKPTPRVMWYPSYEQIMEDKEFLRARFQLDLAVPLVVEPAVGQHWGETEEWKAA